MSAIDTLPTLRAVIAEHGLSARKSLGQNFLMDLNLTAKIARQAGDLSSCDVLEIGPGPGGLTRGLLAEGARKVLAVEKDIRCMPALAQIAAAYPKRLQVINADALTLDVTRHLTPPIRVGGQSALQCGHRIADPMAGSRSLAALLDIVDADVSARGRAPHRGTAGR